MLGSPYSAFLGWVHRRTGRTVPVLWELRQVGEWTVDSVDCWRVGVCQYLVLQSCRPVHWAPDWGTWQPEQLPLTVAKCREDRLRPVSRYQMDYIKKKQLGLIKEEDELESRVIEVYDKAPGQEPTKVKTEDLITITSSKKKDSWM